MKRLFVSIIVIILLVFRGFISIYAQQGAKGNNSPNPRMSGMHKMAMERQDWLKKLNLTEEQKQKIADMKITFQKSMVDLKAQLQKSRLDLKELMVKGNLNRNDVIDAVEKINKNKNAVSIAMVNHMLDVYQVLTPEQQKIWQENKHFLMGSNRHGNMMMNHRNMMNMMK